MYKVLTSKIKDKLTYVKQSIISEYHKRDQKLVCRPRVRGFDFPASTLRHARHLNSLCEAGLAGDTAAPLEPAIARGHLFNDSPSDLEQEIHN